MAKKTTVAAKGEVVPFGVNLIICEDLRQELHNKVSMMGVFGDNINVGSLPYTFPKLCFCLLMSGSISEFPKKTAEVRVTGLGGAPIEVKVPAPPLQIDDGKGATYRSAFFPLVASPFLVLMEGNIEVTATFDNVSYKLPKIPVRYDSNLLQQNL